MTVEALSAIALPQLELVRRLLRSGDLTAPLSATALQAQGLGGCWPALAWLASLDRAGLEAVLAVAIHERQAHPRPQLELVWTGPEARVSAARDTAVVVRDLFARAQRRVLVAGFAFSRGRDIFEPLHGAMRDRGVSARLFLHLDDLAGCDAERSARLGIDTFIRDNWPFGPPWPALYYDPRTVTPGSSINLHAKCVVVDDEWALIGSANFTHNAHARNIEAGILVGDRSFASTLAQQWQGLIDTGLVTAASASAP